MPAKPLSEDEKAFRAYDRAVKTAQAALESIVKLHDAHREKDAIDCCTLCFKNWPCETHRFAESALAKMKGQLPR